MAHLGFPYSPQSAGDAKIDIKVSPYKVELSSLYVLIPNLFDILRNATHSVTPQQSRVRIIKQYADVPFEELAAYATTVFLAKQAKLPGQPSAEQWAQELLLWQKEWELIQKGY